MKILNIAIVSLLVLGLSTSALAGDLRAAVVNAAQQQASQQQTTPNQSGPMPKSYLWLGTGLFVAGMAIGLNGFLNNSNGSFPEFGEATSTNVKMGAAGLSTAFAGGAILFLGKRASRSPSISFGPGRVTISKRVSW